jgi:hypothetical protein
LFGNTAVTRIVSPKKKESLLPLLTVVFLASYGLMTLLIIEQDAAIRSQRSLIHVLQNDSTQLWAMRGKFLHEKQMAQIQAQRQTQPFARTPLTHAPTSSAPTPSTQTPSTQAPSTQAVPQRHSQTGAGKFARHQTQIPRTHVPQTQVPPMPASDLGDQRRELITL